MPYSRRCRCLSTRKLPSWVASYDLRDGTHLRNAVLLLITAQLFVATSGIFTRMALEGTGPITATFFRVVLASLVAALFAFAFKKLVRLKRPVILQLFVAGATLGIHFCLWMQSLKYVSVGVATLLVSITPFFLIFYEAVTERRQITRRIYVALAVAAISLLAIVANEHGGTAPLRGHTLLGTLYGLGAAATIGVYLVLIRPLQTRYPTLSLISYTYPSAALLLLPISLFSREAIPSSMTPWLGIIGLALCTQMIGHTALAASLRFFRPSVVSLAGLVGPIFAGIAAAVFLHEPLTLSIVIAGAFLLVSVGVVLSEEKQENLAHEILANEP